MPIVRTRKPPVQLDELLGRKPFTEVVGLYQIDRKRGRLKPQKVPSPKGDMVVVEKGSCPKKYDQNIICDYPEYIAEREFNTWVPRYVFYVGQFVSFWTKQSEYLFQIFPTEDPRFGEFRLVDKKAVVRQPGSDFRTAKTKSV